MNDAEVSENRLARILSRPRDSFLWIIIILPNIVLTAFNIHSSFYPEQDIERDMLLGWTLSLLWLLIISIRGLFALWHKLPKNMMSIVLSLVVWVWLAPALLRWFPVGDYVHLAAAYKGYKTKIEASPSVRHEFDWGGWGWAAGPSADRTLVYDPTDRLPQENKIKDAEWREKSSYKSGQQVYYREMLYTRHLYGHFYLVELVHQG